MAYRNFTFAELESKFGVIQTKSNLFDLSEIPAITPSDYLLETMRLSKSLPLTTEKIISEALVFPILREIKSRNFESIELYSGENLDADKESGLNGECDFILAKAAGSVQLKAPLLQVIEAKQGEISKPKPLSQVSAQLIGIRVFNQKANKNIDTIYGVCTSGFEWLFLKLENNEIIIDTQPYFISDLPQLIGILQYIVNKNI